MTNRKRFPNRGTRISVWPKPTANSNRFRARFKKCSGTLVVEVDDPGVSVSINGEEVVITGTGAKEIRLKPGQYKVLALKKGKLVRQEAVTITRNGRQVVRVDGEAESVTENTLSSEHFTQMTDSDRKAAEYVLSIGGTIRVHGMDGDIKSAADLPQQPFELATIVLRGNQQVTDEGLANCSFCKQLTRLDLVRTSVTDAGLAHFAASRKLVILDLVHTSIGDAGLASFQGITTLRHLWLGSTKVTAAGIDGLKKALPACEIEWDTENAVETTCKSR